MHIYILLQILISIIFFISFIFLKNELILNIIIVLPIFINAVISFIYKSDNRLKLSLFFAILADYQFMFKENIQVGIAFFIVVQVFYMLYIRKLKINFLLITLIIINCVLMLLLPQKYILPEGIIYGILSIINILSCFKLSKTDKYMNLMKYAVGLLFICDFIIGIRYFINFNSTLTIILKYAQWISYIPSQAFVVIVATNKFEKLNK